MRTIPSLSIAALMLAVPDCTAVAQSTPVQPNGIVCQPPDCDIRRSLPISLEGPVEAERPLVRLVKDTPASALDPDLPGLTFEQWLFATIEPYLEIRRPELANWGLSFCDERRSAIPRAGPDLCVEVSAPISSSTTVMLVIAVAEGRSRLDRRTEWIPHAPSIRDIYIERKEDGILDTFDVPKLSELTSRLQVPHEKWPAVDLRSAVTWSPQKWNPGDIVRFVIWVENVGGRDAERAEVQVLLAISPLQDNEMLEIRRTWFPRVPAGQRVGFEISAQLPRGDAIVHITAGAGPNPKRMREANPDDNDTTVVVGLDIVKGAPRPTAR